MSTFFSQRASDSDTPRQWVGFTKFSTWVERSSPWGDLGPRLTLFSPSGFFLGFFFNGDWSLQTGPPTQIEWTSFPSLVTAVLITPKSAEPPGSHRIGAIGALVYFLPHEILLDKLSSP